MADKELIAQLASTRLCQDLEPTEIDMLTTFSKRCYFKMGEVLLNQGKKSDGIFIILEGIAVITAKILGAGTLNLTTLNPGDFVGETSLIEGMPSTVSVTAVEDVDALLVDGSYFATLAVFFPATKYRISKAVAKDMCERLTELSKKISFYIMHSHMISKSLLEEMLQTFSRPRIIKFDEMNITLDQFKQLDFFKELTTDEFDALFKNAQIIEAQQFVTLIEKGDRESCCFIVLRGAVQSSIIQDNKFAKLSVLAPFKFFCCTSFIDNNAAVIDFATCEKSILLKFNAGHLKTIKEHNPSLWYKMYEEICRSLVSLEQAANKLGVRLNTEIYNR